MARTETVKQTDGLFRMRSGAIFDDAGSPDAASINLGFKPRVIREINITDRIENEWFEGMTSAHSMRTVADGTRSLQTTGGPTVAKDGVTIGFPVAQNKQYRWYAIG